MTSRNFLFSFSLWVFYIGAVEALSLSQGLPWGTVPAFWVGIVHSPPWIKALSAATVTAGTLMIYFVPGVFVAHRFRKPGESVLEISFKGFLINYFYYFFSTTAIKLFTGLEITREIMSALMGLGVLAGWSLAWPSFSRPRTLVSTASPKKSGSKSFAILYAVFLVSVLYVFREKLFFALFNGDGAEQYWLAHSLKTGVLPTGYRTPLTMIPQFPFAPSVHLNMFAMVLLGNAEFIARLSIFMAFAALGPVLKASAEEIGNGQKLGIKESIPVFLYLLLFFTIVAFRADYIPPVDLTKSSETMLLLFFLCGFYLLVKRGKHRNGLAAAFFVLAAMIRYNGLFMITVFLFGFSLLFKRWKCFLWYLAGVFFVILTLHLSLLFSSYGLGEMLREFLGDIRGLREETFSAKFLLAYLKNYFIFTAGLSVFLITGLKNRYVLLMFLVTLLILILPTGSDVVPAHYFVPVLMFPILSFYAAGSPWKNTILSAVILMELLSFFYVFPRQISVRAAAFEDFWSRVCLNSTDLFEATRRSKKIRPSFYLMDDRVSMYYADLAPQTNKNYIMFFETVPSEKLSQYNEETVDEQKVFLPEGTGWDEFIKEHAFMLEAYLGKDEPFIVRRKDIDPYGEFRRLSRDHGEK